MIHRTRRIAILALWLAAPAGAIGQETQSAPAKRITYDVLYGEKPINLDGDYATGLTWLDADQYLERRDRQTMRVNALSGEATPAVDLAAIQAALTADGELDAETAERMARRPIGWTKNRDALLMEHKDRLHFHRIGEPGARRLTQALPGMQEITLSDSGRTVFYVLNHDLYAIDTASGETTRLTLDGSEMLFNGLLDWVYQEEVFGRGDFKAYWPSPDERTVAFFQLNESQVPLYTLINQEPVHPVAEQANYPKSGDPNPTVKLGLVAPAGGPVTWVDLSRYADIDFLIMRVSWTPDNKLLFSVQNREQYWMELNEADPASGATRVLLRETSPAWVDDIGHPTWLRDGSFLWLSDRDGWRHVYHYTREGKLIRRLTGGDWNIRALHGIDEGGGWVYLDGTEAPAVERHAFRVPLNPPSSPAGLSRERLTAAGFHHRVQFNPSFTRFIDTYSSVARPPQVRLSAADGQTLRLISENDPAELREYRLTPPELHRVATRDGFEINGLLTKPADYDPARRYPVWVEVYAGPDAQTVRNSWNGRQGLVNQALANEGMLVWQVDPRSASGLAPIAAWQCYCRLGQTEIRDIEDSLRYLIERGLADPERIGITGHSYGGYMTGYAMTHSTMFRCGISGSPVTDWQNYDTIYTERYMRMPQNNHEGYLSGCVWTAAENLHGRLLLAHGLLDDNVHFQNAVQLINELHKVRKPFDLMIFPQDRHGYARGGDYYRELTWRFIRENLLPASTN